MTKEEFNSIKVGDTLYYFFYDLDSELVVDTIFARMKDGTINGMITSAKVRSITHGVCDIGEFMRPLNPADGELHAWHRTKKSAKKKIWEVLITTVKAIPTFRNQFKELVFSMKKSKAKKIIDKYPEMLI